MIHIAQTPPEVPFDKEKEKFFVLVVNGIDIDVYNTLDQAKNASEIYKRHMVKIFVFEPTLVFS